MKSANKQKLVVVGSIAFDAVKSPFGSVKKAMGGSAVYFSCAARLFSPVSMVGVVGQDFKSNHFDRLNQLGIDTSGIESKKGKTFFWKGHYLSDLNNAITDKTELNVFSTFNPNLNQSQISSPYLFLANIDPSIQMKVLNQFGKSKWVAMDTMNFWIQTKKKALRDVVGNVDICFMNDSELRQFTNEFNIKRAAKKVQAMGPSIVVVKRGEYGVCCFVKNNLLVLPAYMLDKPIDPTGAGDSFAGGFLGYLAQCSNLSLSSIREAAMMGSIVASYNVESFSMEKLSSLSKTELNQRYKEYSKIM